MPADQVDLRMVTGLLMVCFYENLLGKRPEHPHPLPDVLATVYHILRIDPHSLVNDLGGRPSAILPSLTRAAVEQRGNPVGDHISSSDLPFVSVTAAHTNTSDAMAAAAYRP